jgi:RimJ/RimL family protein N-acetyltransferase
MDDRELMAIDADTGFTYDARGRMLLTNEPHIPSRRPAPRLRVTRTMAGDVTRFGATVPDELMQRLTGIIEQMPSVTDLRAPLPALAAVREALSAHAPITAEQSGPSYRFPDSIAQPALAVQLTAENVEAARDTYPWLLEELADWPPCFAVIHDGAAVSVCFSSRLSAQAAAAGVDTLPEFRGRGYAVAVTAAWATAVRASGRIPLYGTSWDNVASQGVARRLGLLMSGADMSWT